MMTFAKILLGVDNRRNKRKEKKGKGKKASDKYQNRVTHPFLTPVSTSNKKSPSPTEQVKLS